MEPWQSWTAALVIGGGLTYYYTKGSNVQNKAARAMEPVEHPQAPTAKRRQEKSNTKVKEATSKVLERASETASNAVEAATRALPGALKPSKKRKAGRPTATQETTTQSPPSVEVDEAEEMDDKEWARQLEAKQKGVSLAAPSRASKAPILAQSSMVPSGNSDSKSAKTSIARSSPGIDVSDMLEPRAAGPSVLIITGEEKPKKQIPQKAPESKESKKQRQNKKKVEEQRLAREQAEKERQVLLETQRRTAREARGEPAKNGLATAKAPTTSAWSGAESSSTVSNGAGTDAPAKSVAVPLLDTFDNDGASTSSSNGVPTSETTPATVASRAERDLPSKETQLELLNGMDDWNEVPKGRKAKKKAAEPTHQESFDTTVKPAPPPKNTSSVKASAPLPKFSEIPATNGFAALSASTGYIPRVKGHPDDSDWL